MDIKSLYRLYQEHPCITTDSRDCPEGSIFIALKGASFDGNKFAVQSLEKGCAYAIVDDKDIYNKYVPIKAIPPTSIIEKYFLRSIMIID